MPMTDIHLTTEGGGHMVTCDCGTESWWASRGEAERARDLHVKKHAKESGG